MCKNCNLKCCCNCSFTTIFIVFGIVWSIFPMIFISDSLLNTIPNEESFQDLWLNLKEENSEYKLFNYTDYNRLGKINEEYEKLRDARNLKSVDIIIHLIILPTFILLSFLFGIVLSCCEKDKLFFIFFEIISILVKGLCIADKILFEIKRKKLKSVENVPPNGNEDEKIVDIYNDYHKYRTKGIFSNYFLLISIIALGIEIFTFIVLICVNKNRRTINNEGNNDGINNIKKNMTKYGRWSIIFYTIFGFLSITIFIFGNFVYSKCNLRYKDYYEEKKIYNYTYEEYPVLEEIFKNFYNNYEKHSIKNWKKSELIGNIFYYCLIPSILFIFSFLSYIFLLCFKCKGSYRNGFIVLEILSVLTKIGIICYSIIIFKKGLKKKLENEENEESKIREIQFLIKDYYNYYKCKIKYPFIVIIQGIFLLVELMNLYCICNNKNEKNYPHNKSNSSQNFLGTEVKNPINKIIYNYNENSSEETKIVNNEDIQEGPEEPIQKIDEKENRKINIKFQIQGDEAETLEIEADNYERFDDVFNNLQNKYDIFRNKKIHAIINGTELLYLDKVINMTLKSIKDLKIKNRIIKICLEKTVVKPNIEYHEYINGDVANDNEENEQRDVESEQQNGNLNNENNIDENNGQQNNSNIEKNNNGEEKKSNHEDKNNINNTKTKVIGGNKGNKKDQNGNSNIGGNLNINNQMMMNPMISCNNMNNFWPKFGDFNFYGNCMNNINQNININLYFVYINSSENNMYYLQNTNINEKFNEVIEKLLNTYSTLKNYDFNEIFLMNSQGQKIFIQRSKEERNNETLKNLNIYNNYFIYINGEIKGNIFVDLHFQWVKDGENKDFTLKIGNKTIFHYAILKLIEKNKELEDYIITKVYMKENNTDSDNDSSEEIFIEDEFTPKFKTLEEMKINEESIIYFETRENIQRKENIICNAEKQKYYDYKSKNPNINNKILIKFCLSTNASYLYFLFVEIESKFSDCLDRLKNLYPSLKDLTIISATNCGNHLLREENKDKCLFELNIKPEENIVLLYE